MNKKNGVHFYINIMNLTDIIKDEEKKDESLKRTLHRLQTYFTGLSKLIKDAGARIEKYTSGRAHIVFEFDNEDDEIEEKTLEIICSCYIYANDIFNDLAKYSLYTKFKINAGVDYGEYYDYEIEDGDITSIGSVANLSAKIQSYAPQNFIYATKKFVDKVSKENKKKFIKLTDEEKSEFISKVRVENIYKIKYIDMFEDETLEKLSDSLEDVKIKVEDESKKVNLKDIIFESVKKKLSFDNLSLSRKNKNIEECAVICADIRGFTKLFAANDSNLDDLNYVMKEIYLKMGEVVNEFEGTKVQYQGDRLVAIYHDFGNEKEYIIRVIEAGLTLKDKIKDLSNDEDIKKRLNNKKINIGIGCAIGNTIATRLGLNGNKDNIVLGESYKHADICEDKYALEEELVISKYLKDKIDGIIKNGDSSNVKYEILQESFKAKSTTGYYLININLDEYNEKVEQMESEQRKIDSSIEEVFKKETVRVWSE